MSDDPVIEETDHQVTIDNSVIEETPVVLLDPIPDATKQSAKPEIEINVDDCEMLYGVVMETAHSVIGTKKTGIEHRDLPDERRKKQGKLLYNICKKYNIKIPTEFEIVIFGGAMIADWQYMTMKTTETTVEEPKIETEETETDETK